MVVFSKFRIGFVSVVCLLGILFALPNLLTKKFIDTLPTPLRSLASHSVSLGLDLRGGSHIQLEVDLPSIAKEYLTQSLRETRKTLREGQIKYQNLRLETQSIKGEETGGRIEFSLLDEQDRAKAEKILRKVDKDLEIKGEGKDFIMFLPEKTLEKRNSGILEQSIEVVRRRIDATGTKEPNIQRQGDRRIVVQLPGVSDPAEIRRLLGTTAKLTFQWVDESVQSVVETKGGKTYLPVPPIGSVFLPEDGSDGTVTYLPVKKQVIIHGDSLVDAQATFNEHGEPCVSIRFNSLGKKQMYEASKNANKRFAIVLDGKVLSSPGFYSGPIPGGNAQISGHFTVQSASELALLLRAGALPAPLKVVEECTVGPSLGEDSIASGKLATAVAFLLVALFMVIAYSSMGLIADIALALNLILSFAGLSLLGATLTLPGIAGLALTIGMAVDANVLIFERIREELRSGMRIMGAIDSGYRRAFSAILDSNLTTIIGAWILYYYSTGAIKGFAVTLALGVLISMFTALTLTQMLLVAWVKVFKVKRLPF